MNHTDCTLHRAGRTVDRETVYPGWAGFHTRRAPLVVRIWRRWRDPFANVLFAVLLFGALGMAIGWGGRAWP